MRGTILELSPIPLSLPSHITESFPIFYSKHFPFYIQTGLEKQVNMTRKSFGFQTQSIAV